MRRLEKDLYEKFVPDGFVCDDAITYQWIQRKEENLKGQFNFFFDISKGAVNKLSMFVYMVILLVLGAAGNALWDLFKLIVGWL